MKPEDTLRLIIAVVIVVLLVLLLTSSVVISAKLLLIGAAVAFALAALGVASPVGLTPLGLFLWVLAVLIG